MPQIPNRLQTKKEDAETLINLLQNQKDNLWEEHLMFKNQPDIISQFQSMKDEILEWAEDLDIRDEEIDSNREGLWSNLNNFVARLKQYYQFTKEDWDLPDWMYYKPQTNQTGLEFLQEFFDKIDEDLSEDFKTWFDQASPITISQAKDDFEDWKKWVRWADWETYMEKRRNMSRLNNYMKRSLMMTGMTRFEVRVNLHEDED